MKEVPLRPITSEETLASSMTIFSLVTATKCKQVVLELLSVWELPLTKLIATGSSSADPTFTTNSSTLVSHIPVKIGPGPPKASLAFLFPRNQILPSKRNTPDSVLPTMSGLRVASPPNFPMLLH